MNPKEKFEVIISEIERLVNGDEHPAGGKVYYDKQEISDKAFEVGQCFFNARERNVLFQFLLGKNVLEYIAERKMMAAYKYLLETQQEKPYQKAIEIVGVADQRGLIRNFKSQFHINPDAARKKGDTTLFVPVPDWESISRNDRFAQEVESLNEFYRLNDRERNLAVELHNTNCLDIKETFEYIYNYVWMYIEGVVDDNDRDDNIEFLLRNEYVLQMYFKYSFSFDDIFCIMLAKERNIITKELSECSKLYLEECAHYVSDAIKHPWEQIVFYNEKGIVLYDGRQVIDEAKEFTEDMIGMRCKLRAEATGTHIEENGIEEDRYNPDFDENGYRPSYESEENYDYEPDFDDPEWIEDTLLCVESEENDLSAYEIYSDELFEQLCEEIDMEDKKRKLSIYRNIDVLQYWNDLKDKRTAYEEDFKFC